MALAPSPTAVVNIRGRDVTVYAAPSRAPRPRNRWICVCVREHPAGPYAHELFGGADRDNVTRRAARGDFVFDTGIYDWIPTPARKVRY